MNSYPGVKMSYTLQVVSHHPQFANKALRKYSVDGIETVGAYGDEPFEIEFKNNSYQKVQVKISLDGTDILSGEAATTEPTGRMWVVNGYGTLRLKAWPETQNGGAAFVFTNGQNGVSVNLRGDTSNNGIIAAAVFVESYVAPIQVQPIYIDNSWPYGYRRYSPYWYNNVQTNCFGDLTMKSTNNSNNSIMYNSAMPAAADARSLTCDTSDQSYFQSPEQPLESLASVGAGDFVSQKIENVEGLIKPAFSTTVRMRYMWWDNLVAKLKQANVPAPHASGFPGDKVHGISLGGTPRIHTNNPNPRGAQHSYARV